MNPLHHTQIQFELVLESVDSNSTGSLVLKTDTITISVSLESESVSPESESLGRPQEQVGLTWVTKWEISVGSVVVVARQERTFSTGLVP